MRILLAGGGSGGHVTPLKAIAQELLGHKNANQLELTVISDRAFFAQTQFLFKDLPEIELRKIFSGKLRRYNGKSALWHMTHLPTVLKNLRDVFLVVLGITQSIAHFTFKKPDVVFCKGGYVCIPVGIAARLFSVPIVIHDSDTHPGLTNRFLSRWAVTIGTGMPPKYYQYESKKMVYSGIPVQQGIKPISRTQKQDALKKLGLDNKKPVLLVTGGGTGAKELNNAVIQNIEALLDDWQVVQQAGKGKADQALKVRESLPSDQQGLWQIHEFIDMLPALAASDVIVSRAGATAMQEFANAAKVVLLVPNPYLTGGHQLKNAAMFKEEHTVEVIQEVDLKQRPKLLPQTLKRMLKDKSKTQKMAEQLHTHFAKPRASAEIAELIFSAASKNSK